MKVIVDILSGTRAGRRLRFDDPAVLRVGRHPDCEIAFDAQADLDASSKHAELRREGDAIWLHDLDSANGTRVGHRSIHRIELSDGMEVEFGAGGPRCVFHLVGPGEAEPAPRTPIDATRRGGRVGASTVAAMIADALAAARAEHGAARSTTFMRALVRSSVSSSTRAFKLIAVGLAAGLVAMSATLVLVLRQRARPEAAIRADLMQVMARQRDADSQALRAQLASLNAELSRARGGKGGSEVARIVRELTYLIAVRGPTGDEQGFCTGFAVAAHELATNAHCVVLALDLKKRGGSIVAIRNGDAAARHPVGRMTRSPAYVPGGTSITPDVGLLHVEESLPRVARLAPAEALAHLQPGDTIYTAGFPGRLADAAAPEATFVEGVIGRLTRLEGALAASDAGADDRVLIQHSAFTAGGTSGSPILDGEGRVVAVNAGGYVQDGEVQVRGAGAARGGASGTILVSQPLPGYNFGMRIDLLQALMRDADR